MEDGCTEKPECVDTSDKFASIAGEGCDEAVPPGIWLSSFSVDGVLVR